MYEFYFEIIITSHNNPATPVTLIYGVKWTSVI